MPQHQVIVVHYISSLVSNLHVMPHQQQGELSCKFKQQCQPIWAGRARACAAEVMPCWKEATRLSIAVLVGGLDELVNVGLIAQALAQVVRVKEAIVVLHVATFPSA